MVKSCPSANCCVDDGSCTVPRVASVPTRSAHDAALTGPYAALMRKSARLLGHELRMNAREVNALLKEQGYLEGKPGAYFLTEKSKQYGEDQDVYRGNDRSLRYSASWTTTTWDDSILLELKAGMKDAKGKPLPAPSQEGATDGDDYDWEPAGVSTRDEEPEMPLWLAVAVIAGLGAARSPRVQRWVSNSAQPRAQQFWRKAKGPKA